MCVIQIWASNSGKKRTPRTWVAVCGLAAVSTQQSTTYVKGKSHVYIHSHIMQFYVYFEGIRHKKNMLHCHLHLSLRYLCIPQSSDRVSRPFWVRLQQSATVQMQYTLCNNSSFVRSISCWKNLPKNKTAAPEHDLALQIRHFLLVSLWPCEETSN